MDLRNREVSLLTCCRQLWHQSQVRRSIRSHVAVMKLPQLTRRLQRAGGTGVERPLHYTDGFCLRIYGDWYFLAFRNTRIIVVTHPDFR